jgi:hypothetical protein
VRIFPLAGAPTSLVLITELPRRSPDPSVELSADDEYALDSFYRAVTLLQVRVRRVWGTCELSAKSPSLSDAITRVENPWPDISYFLLSATRSQLAACRAEAIRLAMGSTKAPDCRYGLVQAASDRHGWCCMPPRHS